MTNPSPPSLVADASSHSANCEIQRALAQAQSGKFLSCFEYLIACGYRLPRASMVLSLRDNTYLGLHLYFLRDLPPIRSPYSGTDAEGGRCLGRRPITPKLLLTSRTTSSMIGLLKIATSTEILEIERDLPELLELDGKRRDASSEAAIAYQQLEAVTAAYEALLLVSCPSPAQRRRLSAMYALKVEAERDWVSAKLRRDAARDDARRALGLPPLRRKRDNASRHRSANKRRFRRWWERSGRGDAASDTPPRWKDLDEAGYTYFAMGAAYGFGSVSAFSLNLTLDVDALARRQVNPAKWLHHRIDDYLRKEFDSKLMVHLVLELNDRGMLHAHGVIAGHELVHTPAVEQALKRAGGLGYRGRNQVDIAIPRPDSGWASYATKDFGKAFPWAKRSSTSQALGQAARDLFEQVRAFVIKHQDKVPRTSRRISRRATPSRRARPVVRRSPSFMQAAAQRSCKRKNARTSQVVTST